MYCQLLSVPDLAMSINDVCVFVPAWLGSVRRCVLLLSAVKRPPLE